MPVKTRLKRRFTATPATREGFLTSLPLPEFFVDEGSVVSGQRALKGVLDAGDERDVQRVLQKYPRLLVRNLALGLGWVIPPKRLGSEFVTDFLIAERLSPGFYWQAVELESPKVPMFTKAGDPSRYLTQVRQIQGWRGWLESNQAYASRPKAESGLGLADISPRLPGLILIGRRDATNPETHALRRQMSADLRIEIRSFDSLLDEPKKGLSTSDSANERGVRGQREGPIHQRHRPPIPSSRTSMCFLTNVAGRVAAQLRRGRREGHLPPCARAHREPEHPERAHSLAARLTVGCVFLNPCPSTTKASPT